MLIRWKSKDKSSSSGSSKKKRKGREGNHISLSIEEALHKYTNIKY